MLSSVTNSPRANQAIARYVDMRNRSDAPQGQVARRNEALEAVAQVAEAEETTGGAAGNESSRAG